MQSPPPNSRPPEQSEFERKRELMGLVLARTLKRNGVPPQWIGGEVNPMYLPDGGLRIELRLSVQIDEPRLLTYLTSLQADFERRLLDIAPDARQWVAGIVWTLSPDPIYEAAMPTPEYWEHVIADRELIAREKGGLGWDRDALARHFVDTNPGELLVDFDDTNPPERGIEDLVPPKG